MIRKLTRPRFETATITFQNGHSVKLPSIFIYSFLNIFAILKAYQRSFFVQWVTVSVEIHVWTEYRDVSIISPRLRSYHRTCREIIRDRVQRGPD